MDNEKSRKLLQQLHDEIHHTQAVDEKGKELLRDLDGDIRALLERSEEHPMQVHPTIIKRMESTVGHFEVTHPEMTTLISKFLATLSNLGI